MSCRGASDPWAVDEESIETQEAREELDQSQMAQKQLNQRLGDTFKTRYFGDRCLDQLSSLLRPTLSGAPSGIPKLLSLTTTAELFKMIRTDPETSRICERYHDVEVQGNSVYIAVARLIAHLLSPRVDNPLQEKTQDPELFLHLCFPSPFDEFWGIRCSAWQEWPEKAITSEDVVELISQSAQLSPLLSITDHPAVLIDLMNHPSLASSRETLVQAGQIAIIDTEAMQRLGVRYGRSTTMAGGYPSKAGIGMHIQQAQQQAPSSTAADQGKGLLHLDHWIVERWIPVQAVRSVVEMSDFLTICREHNIVDATGHVFDQKAYENTASILTASPPQPDTSQQQSSGQDPMAFPSTSTADAAQPEYVFNPTATPFQPLVSPPGEPQHPASTTQTQPRFPRLPGNPIRITKPVDQSDGKSGSEKADQTRSI